MALVELRDCSFGYHQRAVISGISLVIESGDYLCIVGENGAGKSTLAKALVKLLPPLAGEIIFTAEIKCAEIGYLAQTGSARPDFPAGVDEIVLSGRLAAKGWRPFYSAQDKKIAHASMELLSITDLRHRCFSELSGGQQRRVLLARALTASQKMLILDEPATGFDPIVAAEAHCLLKKINDELGVTIVMVSHNLTAAVSHANKILHLKKHVLFFGAAADYLQSEAGRHFLKHR